MLGMQFYKIESIILFFKIIQFSRKIQVNLLIWFWILLGNKEFYIILIFCSYYRFLLILKFIVDCDLAYIILIMSIIEDIPYHISTVTICPLL